VPSRKPSDPPWQVIREEIRSQNRATIEAVQAMGARLERKIEDGLAGVHIRLDAVVAAARQNNGDAQYLTQRVGGLEMRVAVLGEQKA
jgi:hypothetical protein